MSKTPQTERIMNVFRSGGSLTVADALECLQIYALSQRAGQLRRSGEDVCSVWEKSGTAKYKRYYHKKYCTDVRVTKLLKK